MVTCRVGISGWQYAGWRGGFYPPGLPHSRELEYAASRLSSIELNGSFYSLQSPSSYQRWAARTPPAFVFAVKGGRFITHLRRLVGVETGLANFFASGVLALGPKLGPILWQLPPTLAFDADRIDTFLSLLPRDTAAGAELARKNQLPERIPPYTETDEMRPIRHALEVRHTSFAQPEAIDLLRRHGVALVVADTAGRWPLLFEATADHVYIRLHGEQELYVSGYDDASLDRWAQLIRNWSGGTHPRDVFVYFDNDVKGYAPLDAMALAARLGVGPLSVPSFATGTGG